MLDTFDFGEISFIRKVQNCLLVIRSPLGLAITKPDQFNRKNLLLYIANLMEKIEDFLRWGPARTHFFDPQVHDNVMLKDKDFEHCLLKRVFGEDFGTSLATILMTLTKEGELEKRIFQAVTAELSILGISIFWPEVGRPVYYYERMSPSLATIMGIKEVKSEKPRGTIVGVNLPAIFHQGKPLLMGQIEVAEPKI